MDSVEELKGLHVIEIGLRQAWPFVTFCCFGGSREVLLFIDTDLRVLPNQVAWVSQESPLALDVLVDLNMQTVEGVEVRPSGALLISFVDGHRLEVRGEPNSMTSQDVWWLGERRLPDLER